MNDIVPIWKELYPAEKQRIFELMIEKVVVNYGLVDIWIMAACMESLARELDEQDKRLQGISTKKLEEQAWINA
ncbi:MULTISPECIES: hypothetical protein [unclassified Bartonella]|uniref:hypothetical protein n=1 Tax=unclassified Bartonella TaxID=2645622 RepID=UPI0035D0444A